MSPPSLPRLSLPRLSLPRLSLPRLSPASLSLVSLLYLCLALSTSNSLRVSFSALVHPPLISCIYPLVVYEEIKLTNLEMSPIERDLDLVGSAHRGFPCYCLAGSVALSPWQNLWRWVWKRKQQSQYVRENSNDNTCVTVRVWQYMWLNLWQRDTKALWYSSSRRHRSLGSIIVSKTRMSRLKQSVHSPHSCSAEGWPSTSALGGTCR